MSNTDTMERLRKLAEKYGVALDATTPETAADELYRKVPALRRQRAAAERDFVPKGDPRGLRGPFAGGEPSWEDS